MCLKESKDYLQDRLKFLKKYAKIEYRLVQSSNEDILFVNGSSHFISTGGGYGELLSKIK